MQKIRYNTLAMTNPETASIVHPLQHQVDELFLRRAGSITKWYARPFVGPRNISGNRPDIDATNLGISFLMAQPETNSAVSDLSALFRNSPNVVSALDQHLQNIGAQNYETLTFITPHDSLLDIVIPSHVLPRTKHFSRYIGSVENQYMWLGRMLTYVGYGLSRESLVENMIIPKANTPLIIPRTASTEYLYDQHGNTIERLNSNAYRAQKRHAKDHPSGQKIHFIAPSGSEMKKDKKAGGKVLGTISEGTFSLLYRLSTTGPIIVLGCGLHVSMVALASRRLAPRPNLRFAIAPPVRPNDSQSRESIEQSIISNLLFVARQTGGSTLVSGYRQPDGTIVSYLD